MAVFDINKARQEGYTDEEIAKTLSEIHKFDLNSALLEGYSYTDIASSLAELPIKTKAVTPLPSLPETTYKALPLEEESYPVVIGKSIARGILRPLAGLGGVVKAGAELLGTKPSPIVEKISKAPEKIEVGVGESEVKRYLSGILESTVNSLALLLLTRNPAPLLTLFGITSGGGKYTQLREAGMTPEKAIVGAVPVGVSEAVTELLPAKTLLSPATKSLLTRIAKTTMHEMWGEQINTLVEDIVDKTTIRPDMTFMDYLRDVLDTFVITAGQSALTAGIAHPFIRKAEEKRLVEEQERALKTPDIEQAKRELELIEAIKKGKMPSFSVTPEEYERAFNKVLEEDSYKVINSALRESIIKHSIDEGTLPPFPMTKDELKIYEKYFDTKVKVKEEETPKVAEKPFDLLRKKEAIIPPSAIPVIGVKKEEEKEQFRTTLQDLLAEYTNLVQKELSGQYISSKDIKDRKNQLISEIFRISVDPNFTKHYGEELTSKAFDIIKRDMAVPEPLVALSPTYTAGTVIQALEKERAKLLPVVTQDVTLLDRLLSMPLYSLNQVLVGKAKEPILSKEPNTIFESELGTLKIDRRNLKQVINNLFTIASATPEEKENIYQNILKRYEENKPYFNHLYETTVGLISALQKMKVDPQRFDNTMQNILQNTLLLDTKEATIVKNKLLSLSKAKHLSPDQKEFILRNVSNIRPALWTTLLRDELLKLKRPELKEAERMYTEAEPEEAHIKSVAGELARTYTFGKEKDINTAINDIANMLKQEIETVKTESENVIKQSLKKINTFNRIIKAGKEIPNFERRLVKIISDTIPYISKSKDIDTIENSLNNLAESSKNLANADIYLRGITEALEALPEKPTIFYTAVSNVRNRLHKEYSEKYSVANIPETKELAPYKPQEKKTLTVEEREALRLKREKELEEKVKLQHKDLFDIQEFINKKYNENKKAKLSNLNTIDREKIKNVISKYKDEISLKTDNVSLMYLKRLIAKAVNSIMEKSKIRAKLLTLPEITKRISQREEVSYLEQKIGKSISKLEEIEKRIHAEARLRAEEKYPNLLVAIETLTNLPQTQTLKNLRNLKAVREEDKEGIENLKRDIKLIENVSKEYKIRLPNKAPIAMLRKLFVNRFNYLVQKEKQSKEIRNLLKQFKSISTTLAQEKEATEVPETMVEDKIKRYIINAFEDIKKGLKILKEEGGVNEIYGNGLVESGRLKLSLFNHFPEFMHTFIRKAFRNAEFYSAEVVGKEKPKGLEFTIFRDKGYIVAQKHGEKPNIVELKPEDKAQQDILKNIISHIREIESIESKAETAKDEKTKQNLETQRDKVYAKVEALFDRLLTKHQVEKLQDALRRIGVTDYFSQFFNETAYNKYKEVTKIYSDVLKELGIKRGKEKELTFSVAMRARALATKDNLLRQAISVNESDNEVLFTIQTYINNILGEDIFVELVDHQEFAEKIKKAGYTKSDVIDIVVRTHGISPKPLRLLPLEEIVKQYILGASIVPKNLSLMVSMYLNKNQTTRDILRTAFHEIADVLVMSNYLNKNDVEILKKKFKSQYGRVWKEEMADAFANYMLDEEALPQQDRNIFENVFKNIKRFIERLSNFVRGLGYRNVEDIFADIKEGKFKRNHRLEPIELDLNKDTIIGFSASNQNLVDIKVNPEEFYSAVIGGVKDVLERMKAGKLGKYEKMLLPPQWSNNPVVQGIFGLFRESDEYIQEKIAVISKPILPELIELKKRNKEEYNKLSKAIDISNRTLEVLSESDLKTKLGLSQNSIKLYYAYKKSLDDVINLIMDTTLHQIISSTVNQPKYRDMSQKALVTVLDSLRKKEYIKLLKDIELESVTTKDISIAIKNLIVNKNIYNIGLEKDRVLASEFINELYSTFKNIEEQRNTYLSRFYDPRIRPNGRWVIHVFRRYEGKNPETGNIEVEWVRERLHTNPSISEIKENIQKNMIINNLKKEGNVRIFKSEEEFNEFKNMMLPNDIAVIVEINKRTPETLYERASKKAVLEYMDYLTTQMKEQSEDANKEKRETILNMCKLIREEIDKDWKARSLASARFIRRLPNKDIIDWDVLLSDTKKSSVILGYETDPVTKLRDYIIAEIRALGKLNLLFNLDNYTSAETIKSRILDDEQLYSWYKRYVDAIISPDNPLSRFARASRAIVAGWFLGLRLSSALIQHIQSFTVANAELAMFENASKEDILEYKQKHLSLSDIQAITSRQISANKRIIKAYADYISNNLTEDEKRALELGVQKGVTLSQYITSLMQETDKVLGKNFTTLIYKSLFLMQKAEESSRKIGFLSAYRLAKEKLGLQNKTQLTDEELETLFDFGKTFVDNSYFVFKSFNRPLFALGKDGLSSLLSIPLALKSWQINFIGWAYKSIKNQYGKVYADKLLFTGLYFMLFGGIGALPMLLELSELMRKILNLFGANIDKPMKEIFLQTVDRNSKARKSLEFGLLAPLFGIDISGSLQMDLLPKEWGLTGILDTFFGVWTSVGTKFTRAKYALETGQYAKAIASLSPTAIERTITAMEYLSGKPVKSLTGKTIFKEFNKPLKINEFESALLLLGLRPVELSEMSSVYQTTMSIENYWERKRNKIYTKIKTADSYNSLSKILKTEVNNYNESVKKYGGVIPLITSDSIRNVLSQSDKPPKRLTLLFSFD